MNAFVSTSTGASMPGNDDAGHEFQEDDVDHPGVGEVMGMMATMVGWWR